MKILFDQNISYRIVGNLKPKYGSTLHVKDVGLINATDYEIFMFARNSEIDIVVTIDEDFVRLLDMFSNPPKIVWMRVGNCSTNFLAELLTAKHHQIENFCYDPHLNLYKIIN